MRKKGYLILAAAILAITAAGCKGTAKNDTSIVVKRNGKVAVTSVESFDQDYYDKDELSDYVEEQIAAYTQENDKKSVKLHRLSVKNKKATLTLTYESSEDYASFNDAEFFTGTVPQAMAADYTFDAEFQSVKKGKISGTADRNTIINDGDLKTVILREEGSVTVPGTIRYVSAENVTVTSKNSVTVARSEEMTEGDLLPLIYIIYQ